MSYDPNIRFELGDIVMPRARQQEKGKVVDPAFWNEDAQAYLVKVDFQGTVVFFKQSDLDRVKD